jgi:putative ABC transport system permease protein
MTVFSLIISIVLFLSVSFFTDSLQKSIQMGQDGVNFDLQLFMSGPDQAASQELLPLIAQFEEVTELSRVRTANLHAFVGRDALPPQLLEQLVYFEDDRYPYYVELRVLDDESLKAYAVKAGADSEQLLNAESPVAIVVDQITYRDREAGKVIETAAILTEVGQSLDLYTNDWRNGEYSHLAEVEIVALTDQLPMGAFSTGPGGLNLIISERVLDQLLDAEQSFDVWTYLFMKSDDPFTTQRQIEEMTDHQFRVFNVYQARQQEDQMVLLMSIFTYGFIVLITAISIANIFNTISTSIALRKREFAMLRSVGMTPQGFNKMINYESIFYGIKALLYGLPISLAVIYLIYRSLTNTFMFSFDLPWLSIFYVIIAIFLIVGAAMLYASAKVKKENIIDSLKQENI